MVRSLQDPCECVLNASRSALSVLFVLYPMCMCHDFFSVCFQSKVYLALRKWKPAQIRLNPESSCLSVKYFMSKHVFTSLHGLHRKLICFWMSRKLLLRCSLYTITCFPKIFSVLMLVFHADPAVVIGLINHLNIVGNFLHLCSSKNCFNEVTNNWLLWTEQEHFHYWETPCLQALSIHIRQFGNSELTSSSLL